MYLLYHIESEKTRLLSLKNTLTNKKRHAYRKPERRVVLYVRVKNSKSYFIASSIATATATVIPTMGLLPISVGQEITANQWLFGLLNTRIYVRLFVPFSLAWTKCGREFVHTYYTISCPLCQVYDFSHSIISQNTRLFLFL